MIQVNFFLYFDLFIVWVQETRDGVEYDPTLVSSPIRDLSKLIQGWMLSIPASETNLECIAATRKG